MSLFRLYDLAKWGEGAMVAVTEIVGEAAEPKPRIFISYSRKDMAFADRLEASLKARGFEPLIDRDEIYAFEDWWTRIEKLIGKADTVVFVLSPDAVASQVALKEVAYAASLNKRFAPIVCRHVEDAAVPEALRKLNFVFFHDLERFETSADRLAEALQTDIAWIRNHTEYGAAARNWIAAGRPKGLLLRSPVVAGKSHDTRVGHAAQRGKEQFRPHRDKPAPLPAGDDAPPFPAPPALTPQGAQEEQA
jgi:hypothetical protein